MRAIRGTAASSVIAFRDISLVAIEKMYDIMGMKAVLFTPAATRQWRKLSADTRKRIDLKLTIYATNGSGDVRRLKGVGGCRLRIGDWRIIFIEDVRSITVIAVGNRKEIYD
jgi:mRNA interferase RelE/StbE